MLTLSKETLYNGLINTKRNRMINCICINDHGRPRKIPKEKWIKEGEIYTVIFAVHIMPQEELAFQLEEIDLDNSCLPFEFFLANRFAFMDEDIHKMTNFIQECIKTSASIKDLMKQMNILHS